MERDWTFPKISFLKGNVHATPRYKQRISCLMYESGVNVKTLDTNNELAA